MAGNSKMYMYIHINKLLLNIKLDEQNFIKIKHYLDILKLFYFFPL